MKTILFSIVSLVVTSAFAVDPFQFKCNLDSGAFVEALPGLKKAPENPVVGLNIKVLKNQPPLYLIDANTNNGVKPLFATDWTTPDNVSEEGNNLLSLLGLFFGIDTDNIEVLRAALPTDLLDGFAYLEIKDKSGVITKLGFEGTTPSTCD